MPYSHDDDKVSGEEMDRQAVSSATIRAIGFDVESGVLEIEFHEDGVYRYFSVPEFLYRGLMLAKSKGVFFNQRIKGRFAHERTE